MKYREKRKVFLMLRKAGWLLVNLAFGLLVWIALVLIAIKLDCVRRYDEITGVVAIIYTAPIGMPIGVFLLHAIFYKITKLDLRVFFWTFFLSSWLLGIGTGLSYPKMPNAIQIILSIVAFLIPLLVLGSSIAFCIYEAVKMKRPTRFKSKYAWKSES